MASSSVAAVRDASAEFKAELAGVEAQPPVAVLDDAGGAVEDASLADFGSQSQSQSAPTVFACSSRSSDKLRADLQRGVLSPALRRWSS